jgi:hypothetical protein
VKALRRPEASGNLIPLCKRCHKIVEGVFHDLGALGPLQQLDYQRLLGSGTHEADPEDMNGSIIRPC